MKRNNNSMLIDALRKQIKVIAFDANLFDLGIITDNPYQESCSKKRKKLNVEIMRLGGKVKPLPFQEVGVPAMQKVIGQMSLFAEAE